MKHLQLALILLATAAPLAHAPFAQAQESAPTMQNGAEHKRAGETTEQKGKRLLDQMLVALGGDAWLHKQTMYREGRRAFFFRNEPTGNNVSYVERTRFAQCATPQLTRLEYISGRGVITPGTKRDLVHLWTADNGYEVSYKGQTTLPKEQVVEYLRRRNHSLEEVMRTWIHLPGITIEAVGSGMRDRRPVDLVNLLTATNDSITIEIEQDTHLPLQRSFQWRNEQFKDLDLDEEVYGDWKDFGGIQVPMNMTNYRNGDMVAQNFYKNVHFNQPMPDELFDHTRLLKK
jgi:hypothetical protein